MTVELEERLPEALEVAAYYLISESLANVGKYANASSATVEVARSNGTSDRGLDDGIGGADTGAARVFAGSPTAWRRSAGGFSSGARAAEHACPGGDSVRAVIAEDGVLLRGSPSC